MTVTGSSLSSISRWGSDGFIRLNLHLWSQINYMLDGMKSLQESTAQMQWTESRVTSLTNIIQFTNMTNMNKLTNFTF